MTTNQAKAAMRRIPFGAEIPPAVLFVIVSTVSRQAFRTDMSLGDKRYRRANLRALHGVLP